MARRPQPSKASFMPQMRLKPLLAHHPTSPMPSLGPCAPLGGGFKRAGGRPVLTLLCSSCRRDFGDTQGLGSACPLQGKDTAGSSFRYQNHPVLSLTQCPSFTPNHSTSGGRGQKCHPKRGQKSLSQGLMAQFGPRWGVLCAGPPAHGLCCPCSSCRGKCSSLLPHSSC